MSASSLYIVSPTGQSGKTSIIISMGLKALELGKKVGYFKPIGYGSLVDASGRLIDEDVKNMKEILKLEEDSERLCPVVLEKYRFLQKVMQKKRELREKIVRCYREISAGRDLMLIDGPNSISGGIFMGCSVPDLAKEFGSRIIVVSTVRDDSFLDELLLSIKFCTEQGVPPAGVILNRMPKDYPELERMARHALEGEGIELLGSIPNRDILDALRVKEIHEFMGGEILAGREGMENLVQNFLIGAMSMESAMKYFRRTTNKLVIVGGDRTDIISAALETRASAVIATGNLHPSVKILPRADELKIPIILVPHDTYTTLSIIQKIVGKIKPGDTTRIELLKKLFEENVWWKKIIA
jgi:hypothetical protein